MHHEWDLKQEVTRQQARVAQALGDPAARRRVDVYAGDRGRIGIGTLRYEPADDAGQHIAGAAAREGRHLVWVLAGATVRVRDDRMRSLEDNDRTPFLGRLARRSRAVGGDRLDCLAGETRQLARVWRQDTILSQLSFRTR